MRKIRIGHLIVGIFLSAASYAQVGGPGTVIVGGGGSGGAGGGGEATSVQGSATLPATCTELDLYQDTDSGGTEFYICTATNTWTKAGTGDGTIGGTLGATDNGVCRADGTGTLTAQGSPLTISDVSGVTTTLATITPAATTGATVAGQALAITASPAVASTDTAGAAAGGSITITAGAAARNTSGNANGGDINLVTGAGIGTGTAGQVTFPNGTLARPSAGWVGGLSGIYYDAGLHIAHNGGERLILVGAGTQLGAALMGQGNAISGYKHTTTASTAGSGSPLVLTSDESFNVRTNEGSTAENYYTLPAAVSGYQFTFVVQDADGIRITAAAGDTIRPIAGTAASAAAGFIRCATQGAFITLVAINATEWVAIGSAGVWTIDV